MNKVEIMKKLKEIEEKLNEYEKQIDNHTTYADLKYNLYGEYSDDLEFGDISAFPDEIKESLSNIFDEYNYRRRKLEADYGLIVKESLNHQRTKVIPKRKITNYRTIIRNTLATLLVASSFLLAVKKTPEIISTVKQEIQYNRKLKEYESDFIDNVITPNKVEGANHKGYSYAYDFIAEELYKFGYGRFDTNLFILSRILEPDELDKVLEYTEYKSFKNYLISTNRFLQDANINDPKEFQTAFDKFQLIENNLFDIFYGEDFEERKIL